MTTKKERERLQAEMQNRGWRMGRIFTCEHCGKETFTFAADHVLLRASEKMTAADAERLQERWGRAAFAKQVPRCA